MGGVAPISVYVQTEKHRIKNIYAAYPHGNADDLVNALIKKYGKYSDFSDGSYNWYGKNVFVMTGKSGNNTSFVVYTYVVPRWLLYQPIGVISPTVQPRAAAMR